MKIAIDSYTYHRQFGEVYAGLEEDPGYRITMASFVEQAHQLGAQGVSIESCFLPEPSLAEIDALREQLDQLELECVWAWGHPGGLGSGRAPEQLADLNRHAALAARAGARVMRICCGGRRTRIPDWAEHKSLLLPLLREAVAHSREHQVVLAIENHIDLLADELVDLVETIDSPWLGVCLDTANNLRMLEDPGVAIDKLAPYTRATHVKDVTARGGDPRTFAFWPSVPVGQGLIDMRRAFDALRHHGYQGLLALEIDYLSPEYPDHELAVRQSLDHMRSLL
ncbi:sugar phosphate isomerase/epimerase family protein [Variovorax sp.]|jgi:sugar phosphate isomerase/epimerase|uniref:sugar phosphate isomerase/epimerase family protein n=1 Tax=Variovorax sp. TaxID=1871043 RepID=UPI0037DA401F